MYYSLTDSQQLDLLFQPETGMGYQIVQAMERHSYLTKRYIVLNSQIAVEINGSESSNVAKIVDKGIDWAKATSGQIKFDGVKVLSEYQYRGIVNEPDNSRRRERGAIHNPKVPANGHEIFVRLSAFKDDLRVDKIHRRLLPGSFTTTEQDYKDCKFINDDPIERYALPNDEKIVWAFYIQPKNKDILQRGTVEPANGKRGGGKEVYFENGTSINTFVGESLY